MDNNSEYNMSEKDNEWYEGLARSILNEYFKERYVDLKREKKDKPDLKDRVNGIGVEVTRAGFEKDFEQDSLFTDIKGKEKDDILDKEERKMKKQGITLIKKSLENLEEIESYSEKSRNFIEIEGYGVCISDTPCYWSSNENVMISIKSKIDSLNGEGYDYFNHYDLYIYSDDFNIYE